MVVPLSRGERTVPILSLLASAQGRAPSAGEFALRISSRECFLRPSRGRAGLPSLFSPLSAFSVFCEGGGLLSEAVRFVYETLGYRSARLLALPGVRSLARIGYGWVAAERLYLPIDRFENFSRNNRSWLKITVALLRDLQALH